MVNYHLTIKHADGSVAKSQGTREELHHELLLVLSEFGAVTEAHLRPESPLERQQRTHDHEDWQIQDDGLGNKYCGACGGKLGPAT